ncbi:MAG TPA: host attachment protein [Devosiaceae bacterium]|jgi:protein required for attachment to host cells
MKPVVTWIVIADGTQACVFENAGPGKGMHPVDGLRMETEALQAREIMADRPGRSMSSVGQGRSAMAYSSDPVEVRETRFVQSVADLLEVKRAGGAFDRLILAAAPNALGDIRKAMTPAVKLTVMAEMPKDLTRLPKPELDRHFSDVLAL